MLTFQGDNSRSCCKCKTGVADIADIADPCTAWKQNQQAVKKE